MPEVLTCIHGHQWEIDAGGLVPVPDPARICPVCGEKTLTHVPGRGPSEAAGRPSSRTDVLKSGPDGGQEQAGVASDTTLLDKRDAPTSERENPPSAATG